MMIMVSSIHGSTALSQVCPSAPSHTQWARRRAQTIPSFPSQSYIASPHPWFPVDPIILVLRMLSAYFGAFSSTRPPAAPSPSSASAATLYELSNAAALSSDLASAGVASSGAACGIESYLYEGLLQDPDLLFHAVFVLRLWRWGL